METLVLGAAGFIGLNLVEALKDAGAAPRCGRRRRTNVLALRKHRLPMVQADLDDPETLRAAMQGCQLVYHAAAHYPRVSLDRDATILLAQQQTKNVLDAAAAAGVPRLVFVSSTATVAPAPHGPSDEQHTWPSAPPLGTYHQVKWAMEQQVLAEDRLETLVACPSGCIGPWDLRVGTSALVVGLARGMDPPHPDGLVNLVDVRDVARALVSLGALPSAPRRLLLSGGGYPLHNLLQRLARRYQVAPPSPPLSPAAATALADKEEARYAAGGERPVISREIVDLILHSAELDTSLAERCLNARWTPLEHTLDAFDAWARRLRILPPLPIFQEEKP